MLTTEWTKDSEAGSHSVVLTVVSTVLRRIDSENGHDLRSAFNSFGKEAVTNRDWFMYQAIECPQRKIQDLTGPLVDSLQFNWIDCRYTVGNRTRMGTLDDTLKD